MIAKTKTTGNRSLPMVLIVDDVPNNRSMMSAVLQHVQADIQLAASGAEALEISQAREPAVVLLDVQMPGMDGYEVASRLHAQEGRAHVPIIIVTAHHVTEQDVREGYGAGAIDYLTKPIVPEYVRAKVSLFLQLHQQRYDLALQEEVNAQYAELRTVLDMVPVGVAITNSERRVKMVNQLAADHLGVGVDEAAGLPLSSVLPDEAAQQPSGKALMEGKIPNEPLLYTKGDGFFKVVIKRLHHGGALASFLAITEDLTEHKKDRLRLLRSERMAAVGALAAGVAHEVNNPLAAAMLNLEHVRERLESLAETTDAEELQELSACLADGIGSTRRVKGIIRGLRTFSRARELQLEPHALLPIAPIGQSYEPSRASRQGRIGDGLRGGPACFRRRVPVCSGVGEPTGERGAMFSRRQFRNHPRQRPQWSAGAVVRGGHR